METKTNTMETEKLTLEDCFKYSNAEIQFKTDEVRTGYIRQIDLKADRELMIECFPISFYHLSVSDCKLQLRTTDSLTDEEKNEINKFIQPFKITEEIPLSFILADIKFYAYAMRKLFDFLRSISVYVGDLPKGTYELVGKAVEE